VLGFRHAIGKAHAEVAEGVLARIAERIAAMPVLAIEPASAADA